MLGTERVGWSGVKILSPSSSPAPHASYSSRPYKSLNTLNEGQAVFRKMNFVHARYQLQRYALWVLTTQAVWVQDKR